MPRPTKKRIIKEPPLINRFKPAGIPSKLIQKVLLTVDEYECIRLADYEGIEHEAAALRMGISRPTFTRILHDAHFKLSSCLIEGKELVIDGGNIEFSLNLYKCSSCGEVKSVNKNASFGECSECGSGDFEFINDFYTGCCQNKR